MIFNWYQNCNTVWQNKHYTDNDAYDHKTIRKQETYLIRYFISVCKYSVDATYERWLMVSGGTADLFKHDEEQCRLEFNALLKAARKIPTDGFNSEKVFVRLYQHEIDYLNQLDAPLWVRQYWLGMLFWYKYVDLQYPQVKASVSVEGWIFRQIDQEHEFKYKHTEINSWSRKNGIPFKKDVAKSGPIIKADWTGRREGENKVVLVIKDPSEFIDHFNLLVSGTKVCKVCGRRFDFSSKTKRDICEKCWDEKEKIRKKTLKSAKK